MNDARRLRRAEATRRWRERNREHIRAYQQANKVRDAEKLKAWRKANPTKFRAQNERAYSRRLALHGREGERLKAREQYYKHRTRWLPVMAAQRREKRRQHPDLVRALEAAYRTKTRDRLLARERGRISDLSSSYIRKLLNNATGIRGSFWPERFVEVYRAKLKLQRLCQHQQTSTNSPNNLPTPSSR